jgi:hypothetical protein
MGLTRRDVMMAGCVGSATLASTFCSPSSAQDETAEEIADLARYLATRQKGAKQP